MTDITNDELALIASRFSDRPLIVRLVEAFHERKDRVATLKAAVEYVHRWTTINADDSKGMIGCWMKHGYDAVLLKRLLDDALIDDEPKVTP